ncbi:MAG: ArsR family transcriptional regulator [Erysipelotrichaceae bacterium]|nr:MAG: ArsR family transcriptional [Erysipelotrichaceae bacterium]TXT18076.1 MAG: ArsR family transcriptional regulator [Erysipelotrichaceae bacterium]
MIDPSLLKSIQNQEFGEPEIFAQRDARLAQQTLHHHPANNAQDAFLLMACANLINAYIKQVKDPKDDFSYSFKFKVSELAETWSLQPLEGVKVIRYKDVTYIEINPLQFSFHHLQDEPAVALSTIQDPWAKLKLQPFAQRILYSAIDQFPVSSETYALQLKALSDHTRLQIFQLAKEGEVCACDLIKQFNLTQPTLSFHMKQLVQCGLMLARKEGKWVKYRLNLFAAYKLKQHLQ